MPTMNRFEEARLNHAAHAEAKAKRRQEAPMPTTPTVDERWQYYAKGHADGMAAGLAANLPQESEAHMPTPLTVACGCAFHTKLGEAGESLLVLTYCPTHAAAPALVAFVRNVVSRYEATLARTSDYTRAHTENRGEPENVRDARALLATIDQTGA